MEKRESNGCTYNGLCYVQHNIYVLQKKRYNYIKFLSFMFPLMFPYILFSIRAMGVLIYN